MRGQLEFIGLAFVVLILVLGMAFFVAFSSPQTDTQSVQEADRLGKNLQSAMLATTIPECGYDLATAIDRCVTQSFLTCGGTPVCEVSEDAWSEMLDAALNQRYYAHVDVGNQEIMEQGGCQGPARLATPTQIVQSNAGEIRLVIEFC